MSKRNEDNVLQALMSHRTIRDAAQAVGMTERAIYNHLKKPAFSARYKAARDDAIRGISNSLRDKMSGAVETIEAVMNDKKGRAQDRLTAAKLILEFANKYAETNEILERLAELEERLENN